KPTKLSPSFSNASYSSYGEELLVCSAAGVQSRLDALVACGVPTGRKCAGVVRRCPAILFARDAKEMSALAEALCGFFSRKEVAAIVIAVPEVLLKNIDELEEKYEYIFFQMCIEGDEFKECTKWATMSLEDIMTRHEFLLKTGRYTTPDPKHPQKKMENPRLWQILDSNDENFAVQVAGVTVEEWSVYRAYSEQLSNRSGKERPYERVKPSRRKAYERQKKEGKFAENYVFDVATPQPHKCRGVSMHHSLYSYNEANNNTVNINGIESIYASLTANQLPVRDPLSTTPCGAASPVADPAMTMVNRPSVDVAALVDRAMTIDEHLQSMPMPLTGWNDHQFRPQDSYVSGRRQLGDPSDMDWIND
ncbi:hypothetical protein GCK32_013761, partial [Trichostrongylus colubriformis]